MRQKILLSGLIAGSLITGCSNTPQLAPEEHLKTAAFAIHMSGEYRSMFPIKEPGSGVIFYHPDTQKWTRLDLKGMDGGGVSFDGEKLHVKDNTNHYAIGKDHTETIPNPNAPVSIIDSQVALPSGGSVTYVNRGKDYEVMITEEGTTEVHQIPVFLHRPVVCDDGSVWVAGNNSSATEYPYKTVFPPLQLYKIYPEFSAQPIAEYPGKDLSEVNPTIICHNGIIYSISDNYNPPPEGESYANRTHLNGSSLISYDIKTGEFKEKEMSGDFAIRADMEQLNSDSGEYYAYGDYIWWVSGYKKLVKTNIHTGVNTAVFDGNANSSFYEQRGKYLFQFELNHRGDGIIYRFNLETEELESKVSIPNIDKVEKNRQYPFDLEIIDLDAMLRL